MVCYRISCDWVYFKLVFDGYFTFLKTQGLVYILIHQASKQIIQFWQNLKNKGMNKKEILNGNKVILKFMGFKFCNDDKESFKDGYFYLDDEDGRNIVTLKECDYEESFNSIMPVVYKCCNVILEQGFIGNSFDELNAKKIYTTHINNSIESIWFAVVEFIKWYNKNIHCLIVQPN